VSIGVKGYRHQKVASDDKNTNLQIVAIGYVKWATMMEQAITCMYIQDFEAIFNHALQKRTLL